MAASDALEPRNVQHKDDRATYLDLEILGHVEQPRLERRGIRHRDLRPAPAASLQDVEHRRHAGILDRSEERRVGKERRERRSTYEKGNKKGGQRVVRGTQEMSLGKPSSEVPRRRK